MVTFSHFDVRQHVAITHRRRGFALPRKAGRTTYQKAPLGLYVLLYGGHAMAHSAQG